MIFRHALIRQTAIWASAFVMTSFALTSIASAQVIHNTGPHSRNTIKLDTNIKCEIQNDNDISVKNKNDQDAKSGTATVQDNTHGGSAITGDAVNQNDTSLNVDVDNTTPLPEVCNRPIVPCRSVCNTSTRNFRSNAARTTNAFLPSAAAIAAPAAALTGGGGAGGASPAEAPILSEAAAVPFAEAPSAAEDFASSAAACSCSCGCGGYGGAGTSAVVSNTGPYSANSVNSKLNDTTTIKNNNDISVNNTNNQTANSGTAKVTGNTFGGDAGSGSSFNGNSTELGVSVAN